MRVNLQKQSCPTNKRQSGGKVRFYRPVLVFLEKPTGYRRSQLFQLVNRAVSGELIKKPYRRINPHLIYTGSDIKLLEKTDELHLRLNGLATKEILRREKKG